MTDSVEKLGVDLRTRVRRLGGKKCKVRLSLKTKNKVFQKSYMKVGGQQVASSRYDASSGDVSHGEVKVKETDGSGSRQKEYGLSVPFHGKHMALK